MNRDMNSHTPQISVIDPLTPALERVKQMLFSPFDPGKWFAIGFTAWLAGLGQGGGGGGMGYQLDWPGRVRLEPALDRVREYIRDNWSWLIPTVIVAAILLLVIWLLLVWLSSRGQFMFLYNVARHRAEILLPWKEYSRQSNSLFLFRLAVGVVTLALAGPMIGAGFWSIVQLVDGVGGGGAGWWPGIRLAAISAAILSAALLFLAVRKLTLDLVVPVMFLTNTGCVGAWRRLLELMGTHIGRLLLYLLFSWLLAIGIGSLVMVVVVLTCCVAGILLAIPYLGAVFLLPVLVFKRAYSAYYLAQYGSEFNVFIGA